MERKVIIWVKDKVIHWIYAGSSIQYFSDDRYTQLKVTSFRLFIVFVLFAWKVFSSSSRSFVSEDIRFDGDFHIFFLLMLNTKKASDESSPPPERTVTESLENEIASSHHVMIKCYKL